jgi:hypothetical protein
MRQATIASQSGGTRRKGARGDMSAAWSHNNPFTVYNRPLSFPREREATKTP